MNWISDQVPRVLRTIEIVVDEVKDTIEDVKAIWKRIKVALDRALMPHPEARRVVLRALEEEFVTGAGGNNGGPQ
jgi:hypothetical protein